MAREEHAVRPTGGITRRRVLAGGAALGATGVLGTGRPAWAGCRPGSMHGQVVVLGGGMGGLATAHELIERGFEVTVIERRALGGKARSIAIPGTGAGGGAALPGEHGFRFFPGFYHHVPDTMRRIPLASGGTVHDNLVAASTTSFARAGRSDTLLYTEPPPPGERNLEQLLRAVRGLAMAGGTIPPQESAYFAKQFYMYMTSSEERRYGQWEHTSWWDYVAAEAMSQEYQRMLAIGLTRNLVAAKAEAASARTIGSIAEAFMTNAVYKDESQGEGPPDQVLNGPTSDVWITPWVEHLSDLGVRFQVGYTVERLEYANGMIRAAHVRDLTGNAVRVEADWFVLFEHPELAALRELDAQRYRLGQPHTPDSPAAPSLPWLLEDFPELEREAGIVAPVTAQPRDDFAPIASTEDAPVAHRDDHGVDAGCAPQSKDEGGPADRSAATAIPASAVLPATGHSDMLGAAAVAALGALAARRLRVAQDARGSDDESERPN